MGGPDFKTVAAHPETSALEALIITFVLLRDKVRDDPTLIVFFADVYVLRHRTVGFDRPDTVDARNRGYDDNIIAFEQGTRRGVAHAVDLFVYLTFFFDVGVRTGDVCFGLVIVVVGYEVLDGIFGKKAFEFAV